MIKKEKKKDNQNSIIPLEKGERKKNKKIIKKKRNF